MTSYSDATSGWTGWALAHPEFGSSVNPIITRGADVARHITACPPGFENLAASLTGHVIYNLQIPTENHLDIGKHGV